MIWSVSFLDDWVFISLQIQGLVCKLVDVCHALWLLPLNAGYFYKSFWTFSYVVLGHLETFDPFQKCFSGLSRGQEGPIVFCTAAGPCQCCLWCSWGLQSGCRVQALWDLTEHSTVTSSPLGVVVLAQPIVVSFCTCLSSIPDVWTRPSKDPRNSSHAAFSFLLLCSTPRLLWRSVLVLPNSQLFF